MLRNPQNKVDFEFFDRKKEPFSITQLPNRRSRPEYYKAESSAGRRYCVCSQSEATSKKTNKVHEVQAWSFSSDLPLRTKNVDLLFKAVLFWPNALPTSYFHTLSLLLNIYDARWRHMEVFTTSGHFDYKKHKTYKIRIFFEKEICWCCFQNHLNHFAVCIILKRLIFCCGAI